jgi:cysteine-rich repeat protein
MQISRSIGLALFVLVLAAAGCDGGGGGTDSGPPGDTGPLPDAPIAMIDAPVGPGTCGDGVRGGTEQCDDGNTTPGDGCDAMCMIEASPTCGDGTTDRPVEECDDGNTTAGDGCSATCRVETPTGCGNGTLELASGEECDDGNAASGDGCSGSCQIEAVGAMCGDMTMQAPEVCDDGNTAGGDGCNPTCNLTGTTSLFAGMNGMQGRTDGVGTAARFQGAGVLTADNTYLWMAEAEGMGGTPPGVLRRIEIATQTVLTVATLPMGAASGGIATNGTDTVWVAGGTNILSISTTGAPPYTVTPIHMGAAAGGAGGFMDGPPGTATFGEVRGLTWWAGSLWIVDTMAAVIRRMDPSTGNVTTVAGMPYMTGGTDGVGNAARFISPRYIVSDGTGTLYISDTNGNAIRAMNAGTFAVTTFAGVTGMVGYVDGVGSAARIHRPRGITADGSSIYFVEFNQHTVRQGVLATADVSTLAGMPAMTGGYVEGTGSAARFQGPWSIAYHFPSNSLFVSDGGNFVIRRIR